MEVRLARLGHLDESTTMGYTHLVSNDDRRVSSQLGQLMEIKKKKSGQTTVLDPSWTQHNKRQAVGLP
jgi:hypothetical protein